MYVLPSHHRCLLLLVIGAKLTSHKNFRGTGKTIHITTLWVKPTWSRRSKVLPSPDSRLYICRGNVVRSPWERQHSDTSRTHFALKCYVQSMFHMFNVSHMNVSCSRRRRARVCFPVPNLRCAAGCLCTLVRGGSSTSNLVEPSRPLQLPTTVSFKCVLISIQWR